MDALLEIVMRDKEWNSQLARKTYVAILALMSEPNMVSRPPEPAAAAGAVWAKASEMNTLNRPCWAGLA